MTATIRTTYTDLMGETLSRSCDLDPYRELELTDEGRQELDKAARQYLIAQANVILQAHGCYLEGELIYAHSVVTPIRLWNPATVRAALKAIDFDPIYCKYGNPRRTTEPRGLAS